MRTLLAFPSFCQIGIYNDPLFGGILSGSTLSIVDSTPINTPQFPITHFGKMYMVRSNAAVYTTNIMSDSYNNLTFNIPDSLIPYFEKGFSIQRYKTYKRYPSAQWIVSGGHSQQIYAMGVVDGLPSCDTNVVIVSDTIVVSVNDTVFLQPIELPEISNPQPNWYYSHTSTGYVDIVPTGLKPYDANVSFIYITTNSGYYIGGFDHPASLSYYLDSGMYHVILMIEWQGMTFFENETFIVP
jgi:hypothetical protein